MVLFNFKPQARVKYIGNSPNLRNGQIYIVEHNFVSQGDVFLKLESVDGKYPGDDFSGDAFNIQLKQFNIEN